MLEMVTVETMTNGLKKILRCIVCGGLAEKCHIHSRGAGGPNDGWNILFLCRREHSLQHQLGWREFLYIYPIVKEELVKRGWEIEDVFGRFLMTHSKMRAAQSKPD